MEATFDKFKGIKTYSRFNNVKLNNHNVTVKSTDIKEPLTTKNAVKFLLEGTLRLKVCRYCLSVTSSLSDLDEILVIAANGAFHEVAIRDMVASFHPFKVMDDTNIPIKICTDCLNRTISCYLFAQQCERAERALRNCLEDMYDKFEKLDPIEPVKRRGKRKLHPNYNILYTEHDEVIDYAEPIINIINTDTVTVEDNKISELECHKCWQVLPTMELLLNHEKMHPKSMWYNCKLCGKSFVKRCHLKRHLKSHTQINNKPEPDSFKCNDCGTTSTSLGDHYQHIEKHKFKDMFTHLIEGDMNDFCAVCMEKGLKRVDFSEYVHLNGGYPALRQDVTIQNVLTAIPGIQHDSYLGTKICENCLNHTLNTFIFISKIQYIRSRLNSSVTLMLDNLDIEEPENNIIVEISKELILPSVKEVNDSEDSDDSDYRVEVLEDEFRIESYSESESDSDYREEYITYNSDIEDQLKNVTRTYSKKMLNGFQMKTEDESLDVCSEFLTFKKRVKTHRPSSKVHFTCPFCDKKFISDYFLKKHVLKHINQTVECHVCHNQFTSRFHLFEHNKMSHLLRSQNYTVCKTCGRSFTNAYRMKIHEKCHKRKECHLCNKYFISQKFYNIHMQRHAARFNMYINKDEQTCSFCEKACSNENELSLHVNKVHLQIKPYSCDMCEKQYYTEYNLLSHKKLHSLLCKEICVFCNKVFKCRKDLVIHVRKHIGIKPHSCPVCRQAFYSDSIMKNHMKNYHGGRFCCRLCRTVLQSQFDLKTHINVAHSSM